MSRIATEDLITVNLYGGLETYSPTEQRKGNKLASNKVSHIKDILEYYNIPAEEVQVVLINGKHADMNNKIPAGSTVSIFPLVGGG